MSNIINEILKETKWETLLIPSYNESFNDSFLSFLLNEYYDYKSKATVTEGGLRQSRGVAYTDLTRIRNFYSRLIKSFCYVICERIDTRSSSLYSYKMEESEIKTALIIENSVFFKKGSLNCEDFKNVLLLMRDEDYDYRLLSNGGFAGVALMFDRDTLYKKASSIGRGTNYMERRYFYIGSIIKYGLIDEKTINFVTSNLSVGMKRYACIRAFHTSENINYLIRIIKGKGESANPTTLSLKSLEIKLFMTKMIIYSTISYVAGHLRRNFFLNDMTLDDVPHLMPLVLKFDEYDKRDFFKRVDSLKKEAEEISKQV